MIVVARASARRACLRPCLEIGPFCPRGVGGNCHDANDNVVGRAVPNRQVRYIARLEGISRKAIHAVARLERHAVPTGIGVEGEHNANAVYQGANLPIDGS